MKNGYSIMKTLIKTISIFLAASLIFSCAQPHKFVSDRKINAITSITASFMNDQSSENSFSTEIDYQNSVITIIFPYNYPRTSDIVVTPDMLTNVRLKAVIADNVIIEPPLLTMDLTKTNYITVTDNSAQTVQQFRITYDIRKSQECELSQFNISALDISGVIDEVNKTISFVTFDPIGSRTLKEDDIIISHGATINPDPRKVPLDYDETQEFTVTAQDGVTKNVYVASKYVPQKEASGIRPGSNRILWTKKLSEIPGVDPLLVTSIAPSGDYLLINQRGSGKLAYLKAKTGEAVDKMELPFVTSDTDNYSATSDDDGNILFCNWSKTGPMTIKIYKAASVTSAPTLLIQASVTDGMGWHLSVIGSVDKNAVISTPAGTGKVAVWQITNGSVVSQTPTVKAVTSLVKYEANNKWNDIIFTSETNANSDYMMACHNRMKSDNTRHFYWCNGDSIVQTGPSEVKNNTVTGAVDYIVFNKAPFVLYNWVNTFTYKSSYSDAVMMFDLTAGSFGTAITTIPAGTYGSWSMAKSNTEGFADVMFAQDKAGYFLYVYFMFGNGYVGCVQYDCIKYE